VPPALAALVMRCLAKRPAERPQSATEVLQALDGIQSQGVPAATRSSRRGLIAGTLGAVVLAAIVAAFIHLRAPSQPRSLRSVAVLPFVNTGGDPKDEYFSDGMTDELAHALARLPDVRVAGRTSSYAYKGKAATAQEIGRALGVGGVIAGTVRRSGDRLRMTVQLSSANDGFELWSHEYESRSADVFQVQDEFTRAIVSELEPALRGAAAAGLARGQRGTADASAYEHYLKGHYFWSRRGTTGLLRSLEEYGAAIARDSSFARAWAGVALAYLTLPSYAPVNADSLRQLVVAAARRALALDSTVTDAHLALAGALTNRGELAAAEVEFRRLLVLAPNDPTVHQWYSELLNARGRVEESLAEVRRAAALDPLSAPIRTDVGITLLSARRYEESAAATRRALELDSTFVYARWLQAQIYALTGHLDSAFAEFGLDQADGRTTWQGTAGWRGLAAWLYALAGRRADAKRLQAESARELGAMGSYEEAMAALGLGEHERAVAALGRSLERHELLAIEASPSCNPIFDPLHRLQSYRELMRRYGMRICDG
jgi:TolB-like protein/Tfp pilus assembly protein PilF